MSEETVWEYRCASAGTFWNEPNDEALEQVLNELGEEGWEVVSVFTRYGSNKVRVVAKRPLTTSNRRRRNWPGT